jgi:hypothetical protein
MFNYGSVIFILLLEGWVIFPYNTSPPCMMSMLYFSLLNPVDGVIVATTYPSGPNKPW